MTMFTAENRQQSCGGYGGGGYGGVQGFGGMSHHLQGYYISDLVVVGGPILMAEDPKEKSSSKDDEVVRDDQEEEEEEQEHEQGWLQLSIGGGHSYQVKKDEKNNENENGNRNGNENENESSRVELELMPPSSSGRNYSNESQLMRPFAPEFRAPMPVMNFANPSSFLLQQQHGIISGASNYTHQQQEIMNWPGFRPPFIPVINSNIAAASSQSYPSSSPAAPSLTYYPQQRQFQLYAATAGGVDMAAAAAVDFRVIQPPKRPHSGIWFMLQASQNQEKEPFLPQISKSYLRIKDGGMTIRLVIKYLVNKLRLDNESEIEIRCRGQRVAPFLTLQHVRDSIWSNPNNRSDDFLTLLPNSPTTPHLMVLHYARSTS